MEIPDARKLKGLEEEPQAEEAPRGVDAGRIDVEENARKKLLTPSLRRRAVRWVVSEMILVKFSSGNYLAAVAER